MILSIAVLSAISNYFAFMFQQNSVLSSEDERVGAFFIYFLVAEVDLTSTPSPQSPVDVDVTGSAVSATDGLERGQNDAGQQTGCSFLLYYDLGLLLLDFSYLLIDK